MNIPIPVAVSPLRQRLIDEMEMRRFGRETQRNYIRSGADRQQVMTLAADEFIRRFLLHVLPRGFHRIRHYGLLAASSRKTSLDLARKLLAVAPPTEDATVEDPADTRPPCPCCGGRMVVIETFERGYQPRGAPSSQPPTGTTTP